MRFRIRGVRLSAVLLAFCAALLAAPPATAKNMGCCKLAKGCTTATATVCRALGGNLVGVGTQICDATMGCVAGVGCATCRGGELSGEMCETPDACGTGGYCMTDVRLFDLDLDLLVQPLRQPLQYAVKFVCGDPEPRGIALARGRYATAINLHNPDLRRSVDLRFKVAQALPIPDEGRITGFEPLGLRPDGAAEIDCPQILRRLEEPVFAKGFVVILAFQPLDVVAVHTAAATPNRGGEVVSLDVERVEPTGLPR